MPVTTNNRNVNPDNKDFSHLLYRYLSFWPLFIGLIIIAMAGAWLYLRYAVPIYESTATILIKDEKKGPDESTLLASLDLLASKKIVENEIEVLRSRTVMKD